MTIQEFQNLIERIYYNRDAERGVEGTFVWFTEEKLVNLRKKFDVSIGI